MTLAEFAEWWKKIAEHYAHSSHRLVFNLNIEWSDVAGKDYEAINLYNQTMADIIRESTPHQNTYSVASQTFESGISGSDGDTNLVR